MRIETENYTLRNWEESDSEDLARIANNKKIFDNLRDVFPHPYSIEDARKYISIFKESDPKSIVFAIEVNGKVCGNVGAFIKDDVYKKSAEIGYFLAEELWGKGIMSSAVKKVVEYVFRNYDVMRIFAEPFARNTGSRKVLEKAGFELEGILKKSVFKNNIFEDSCMYAILNESYNIDK